MYDDGCIFIEFHPLTMSSTNNSSYALKYFNDTNTDFNDPKTYFFVLYIVFIAWTLLSVNNVFVCFS